MTGDQLHGIPFERRPVMDPAAAKAAALRSLNATKRPRKVLLGAGRTEIEAETRIIPSKKSHHENCR
jgi:hypothetical protein